MSLFCVFTPTYNRAHCLPRLYKSLVAQSFRDFTWLVIDDGSTDNTEELIRDYIKDNFISIRYVKVENGGKQRAQNLAVEMCSDELFMCVDSDDWLADDALSTFHDVWESVRDDEVIAGMICPHQVDGNPLVFFPSKADVISAWDLYEQYNIKGDALHVYRTNILKRFPLKVADGEKFISEWYSVSLISVHYKVKVIHRPLKTGVYLPDGYSDRARELARENPVSYYTNKLISIQMSKKLKNKFKHTILYLVGCIFSNNRDAIRTAPNKVMATVCYPLALLLVHTEFSPKHRSKTLERANRR